MTQLPPNDFTDAVEYVAGRLLRYFRTYIGVVKELDDDTIILVHSEEFGTTEDDNTTWLPCTASNIQYSHIKPRVGDYVEFFFPNGVPSNPKYRSLAAAYYTSPNGTNDICVLFEHGSNRYVAYDRSDDTFIVKTGDSELKIKNDGSFEYAANDRKLEMKANGNFQIGNDTHKLSYNGSNLDLKSGSDSLEPAVKADKLKAYINSILDEIANITVTVFGPVGINNAAAFTALKDDESYHSDEVRVN